MKETDCSKCCVCAFKEDLCNGDFCEKYYREGNAEDFEELLPHWIPVSERLPEPEKKEYWICTDGGYQCQCRWTNTNHFWTDLTVDWHWHIMDIPQYSKVVAWMPLPEPYGGDECETD